MKLPIATLFTISAVSAADAADALNRATVRLAFGNGSGIVTEASLGVLLDDKGSVATCSSNLFRYTEFRAHMPNGERYDQLWLTGSDTLRSVAVFRVAWGGGGAPAVAPMESVRVGDKVLFATFNSQLQKSIVTANISIVQTPAMNEKAVSSIQVIDSFKDGGFCGSGAFNEKGELIGIVTGSHANGHNITPAQTFVSLAQLPVARELGSGSNLGQNANTAASKVDPTQWKKDAKTLAIRSDTSFIKAESVARELLKLPDFQKSGIRILDGPRYGKTPADVEVKISKPVLTSYFAYTMTARTGNVMVGAGRIMAWDGETGAPLLAAKIAADLLGPATPPAAKKP